ncbi:HK97 family phage prohead protease [Sphingomonas sp. Leaf10]|uniref:HK97 family phage prohead protease n=1 Tax=Sphingomonas sp. Leaf10 TaxID=1735676 RepID=UPI0009E7652C|nr:HK97 family phage prohead protease [Sphingomonas sp. Leaf10]
MSWRAGIHGYVAQWDVVTGVIGRPNAPHLARPGRYNRDCFIYDPARVSVQFMHRGTQVVGTGKDIDLDIWADAYGLAFAFTPPETAYDLVCGIARGTYDQCSAGFTCLERATARHGGSELDDIGSAVLREISICPSGACPGAVCWHSGNAIDALSPVAASLLPGWHRGRAAHRALGIAA